MDTISFAREFGFRAHGDQLYADRYPFLMHLDRVYWTLREFGVEDPTVLTAAYLHDTIEDTAVTSDTLRVFFSDSVVALVETVTWQDDEDREEGLHRIAKTMNWNPHTEVLKLADRLSNVRLAVMEKTEHILRFYGNEHRVFSNGRGNPSNEIHQEARARMWMELNGHLAEWVLR